MSTPSATLSNLASSQSGTFVRIQAVHIQVGQLDTSAKYPLSFTVIVDGKVNYKSVVIPRKHKLHWHIDQAIYVLSGSRVALNILEKHTFDKRLLAEVSFSGQDAMKLCAGTSTDSATNMKMTLQNGTGNVTVDIMFASTDITNKDIPRALGQEGAEAMKNRQSLLDKLGEHQASLDTITKIGKAVAELNPIAKLVMAFVSQAHNHLKEQKKCDGVLSDLIDGIVDMLPFIEALMEQARTEPLKGVVEKMHVLISHASIFISDYTSDGAAGTFQTHWFDATTKVDATINQHPYIITKP